MTQLPLANNKNRSVCVLKAMVLIHVNVLLFQIQILSSLFVKILPSANTFKNSNSPNGVLLRRIDVELSSTLTVLICSAHKSISVTVFFLTESTIVFKNINYFLFW